MANPFKDGKREYKALDPHDLTFKQLLQLGRLHKSNLPKPGTKAFKNITKEDKPYWLEAYKHPLQDYVGSEEAHYNECVYYGCGCDPTYTLDKEGNVV
jgi:hypothetical protein